MDLFEHSGKMGFWQYIRRKFGMGKRLGIPHGVSYGFGIALRWRTGYI